MADMRNFSLSFEHIRIPGKLSLKSVFLLQPENHWKGSLILMLENFMRIVMRLNFVLYSDTH